MMTKKTESSGKEKSSPAAASAVAEMPIAVVKKAGMSDNTISKGTQAVPM